MYPRKEKASETCKVMCNYDMWDEMSHLHDIKTADHKKDMLVKSVWGTGWQFRRLIYLLFEVLFQKLVCFWSNFRYWNISFWLVATIFVHCLWTSFSVFIPQGSVSLHQCEYAAPMCFQHHCMIIKKYRKYLSISIHSGRILKSFSYFLFPKLWFIKGQMFINNYWQSAKLQENKLSNTVYQPCL